MTVTASSALRGNIYKLLDNVLESGKPLEVERKGRTLQLQIILKEMGSKLSKLTKHDCIQGDPESLVHIDWSGNWK